MIFFTFFRVGLFTFGGGLAMVSVLRHELVFKKRWANDHEFTDELSLGALVPGAIAVNLAYIQGRRLRGIPGSIMSVAGTILPSFICILLVALYARPYFSNPQVASFLKGCSFAVAGQLAYTGYVFARLHLKSISSILITVVCILTLMFLSIHPLWTVILAGISGYFLLPPKACVEESDMNP